MAFQISTPKAANNIPAFLQIPKKQTGTHVISSTSTKTHGHIVESCEIRVSNILDVLLRIQNPHTQDLLIRYSSGIAAPQEYQWVLRRQICEDAPAGITGMRIEELGEAEVEELVRDGMDEITRALERMGLGRGERA